MSFCPSNEGLKWSLDMKSDTELYKNSSFRADHKKDTDIFGRAVDILNR